MPPAPAAGGADAPPARGWRRLTHLHIGSRLGLAFGLLLALTLATAWLAGLRMARLANDYEQLLERQVRTAELVDEARDNIDTVARRLLVLASVNPAARAPTYAEVEVAQRHVDTAMRDLATAVPAGERQRALAQLRLRLLQYREAHLRTVELIEAGDADAARAMLGGGTEAALNLLADAFRRLSEQELAATRASAQALQDHIAAGRRWLALLCCLALAAGTGLAAAVTRGIIGPLREAERVGLELAAGHYRQRVAEVGDDEVGAVARVMNTLAGAVAEREQQLLRLAHTDRLTGLAQRVRFIAEADALLAELSQRGAKAALLCIDVDRLKTVNNILGFDAGDAVLAGAASRLQSLFGEGARLGRVGGGCFVALLPRSDDGSGLAAAVQQAVEHKLSWHGHALDLSVSQGIALFPEHGSGTEQLLTRAEQAMFEAKRLRLRMLHYGSSLEASRQLHLSLLSDLQEALVGGQLRQYLQPKVSPIDGRLHGVEALVRWQHPQRGWLPPAEFVPFAERSGRIRQITQWMIEHAVQTLARWRAEGFDGVIAVNVSTLDLQDAGLPARVAAVLSEAGVPPSALQLELTETGLMASGDEPVQVLHALRAIGVRLAIDDFGTGQSSLAYLQKLPVHELKIDRSFVHDVDADLRRQALLRSIVDIGHSLGLVVTAEGVETAAELAVLRQVQCDLVQGYLVARPMDETAFEAWRRAPRPRWLAPAPTPAPAAGVHASG